MQDFVHIGVGSTPVVIHKPSSQGAGVLLTEDPAVKGGQHLALRGHCLAAPLDLTLHERPE